MLNKIPSDILFLIYKNLEFCDIISMQKTSRELYYKTITISEYIISNELKKFENKTSKDDIIVLLNYVCKESYNNIKNKLNNNKNLSDEFVKSYIYNNIEQFNITDNISINIIYQKLFKYYLKHNDLSTYTDIILIFIFYNLLQINLFHNVRNAKYNVLFLDSFFQKNQYSLNLYNIIYKYCSFLLFNHITLHLDIQHIISKYITSIHYIKKLFCSKQLDLSITKIVSCCADLDVVNLKNIVIYKYNMYNDDLISYNYTQIKRFIKINYPHFFNLMQEFELEFINGQIIYRHPFTRNHMRLNSKSSQRFLFKLRYELNKSIGNTRIYNNLENYIKKKQNEYHKLYFC